MGEVLFGRGREAWSQGRAEIAAAQDHSDQFCPLIHGGYRST